MARVTPVYTYISRLENKHQNAHTHAHTRNTIILLGRVAYLSSVELILRDVILVLPPCNVSSNINMNKSIDEIKFAGSIIL